MSRQCVKCEAFAWRSNILISPFSCRKYPLLLIAFRIASSSRFLVTFLAYFLVVVKLNTQEMKSVDNKWLCIFLESFPARKLVAWLHLLKTNVDFTLITFIDTRLFKGLVTVHTTLNTRLKRRIFNGVI